MADSIYRTPVVMSTDGKNHVPLGSGQKLNPDSLPIDTTVFSPSDPDDPNSPLTISPGDLVSQEPNNPLVVSTVDKKLKVDATKLVAANDPLLSVSDNKIKSTLTAELNTLGQLVLKGTGGKVVATVTLPVVPGLPTVAEYLKDFTPPSSANVIGGSGKGNYLHLQFDLSNGTKKDLYISYTDLVGGGGGGGGDDTTPSTITPADLIVPDGYLVSDPKHDGKLNVSCTAMEPCILAQVKNNFLANGGLATDSDGKFKVDWTKMPSSGGSSSETIISQGFSLGTKIGEKDVNATTASQAADWVLTDVKKGQVLFIKVAKYQVINSKGDKAAKSYCRMKRPFITHPINTVSFSESAGCNVDNTAGHLDFAPDMIAYVDLVPHIYNSGSTTSECLVVRDTAMTNLFIFDPDKNYETLTLSLTYLGVDIKLEAYQ